MTDERFDDLTRSLSGVTSRRAVLKGAVAAALGGVAMRFRGSGSADARARVKIACARLGQTCTTAPHPAGNLVCCPHLACNTTTHVCCKPLNETCASNGECCGTNTCRPNPSGLGNRCLPPGGVGATCTEDSDCAAGFACDLNTGQCGEICGDVTCPPYATCDPYTLTCISDLGSTCLTNADCSSPFHCDACLESLTYSQNLGICVFQGLDVVPGVYDPGNTGTVTAEWRAGQGLPDGDGSNAALYLAKMTATSTDAAAAGVVTGLTCGAPITELGFDFRNDGHCGAGSPRFTVYTQSDLSEYYFFGCSLYGVKTPVNANWTRIRYSAVDALPAGAFPPFVFGVTPVYYIEIDFDEGTDQGVGFAYVDNIDINGVLVTEQGGNA